MKLDTSLNPEQLAAVTLPSQHALILAGAGSGKTRVLIARIAWLISHGHARPDQVLAVTFTNKAAKEMLARLTSSLPLNPNGLWIGTFHSLCNKLLRFHWRDSGLPEAFVILDQQDQLAVIKRMIKGLHIDDERFAPKIIQSFINKNKEGGYRAREVEAVDSYTSELRLLYEEYEKQCQREGVVDFAELLLRTYELLKTKPSLCTHYQDRFRYILIDEFQDTNYLQYKWLKLLAGQNSTLFAVGDDDQAIYTFRGASTDNLHYFQQDFSVEHIIRLEQNYRSHSNILDAANAIISHNHNRLGKHLWAQAESGAPIFVFEGATDIEESAFIANEIQSLISSGIAATEIAVLYRANVQSRQIEHALFTAGVSYRVYGGLRFFDRQEVKYALAYLRLIAHTEDDNALLKVINFPVRGIGLKTVENLQAYARAHSCSLWQAACLSQLGRSAVAVEKFVQLIISLRKETEGMTLPEKLVFLLECSGLMAYYRMDRQNEERVAHLEELVSAAAHFITESQDDLIAFLSHVSLETHEYQAKEHEPAVQLMTVHAAKGLEFEAVFITGLEEGVFPYMTSFDRVSQLEEERRLMYVAVTRARHRLYFTLAQRRMLHGQTYCAPISRFIDEVPGSLLRSINRSRVLPHHGRHEDVGHQARVPNGSIEDGYAGVCTQELSECLKGFHIGKVVEHPRFGIGTITDLEGNGRNIQVNFDEVGTKWLSLAHAKLKSI